MCFSIRLLVEQRISSIRDIFILQNLMKCLGKDAPVFLKKKLEVKLFGSSHFYSHKACSLASIINCVWFFADTERKKCNRKVTVFAICIIVQLYL